nr:MAG: hypothetical protein EDM05_08990 [Leptolyngbya sp. IPPAS B-1204]
MQIHLPEAIAQKLIKALNRAGSKEIGGILMGEYVSSEVYRIVDLTIQSQTGTTASFLRLPLSVLRPLQTFFQKTSNQFTRFNYLGEWHSHPLYSIEPSSTDCEAMWEIVSDPSVGANFAVLLVVKLNGTKQLESGVTVFLPNREMLSVDLIQTSSVTERR